jgi:hypothetical protein
MSILSIFYVNRTVYWVFFKCKDSCLHLLDTGSLNVAISNNIQIVWLKHILLMNYDYIKDRVNIPLINRPKYIYYILIIYSQLSVLKMIILVVLSQFMTYHRFDTRVTRRVWLVEQEQLTLPDHLGIQIGFY